MTTILNNTKGLELNNGGNNMNIVERIKLNKQKNMEALYTGENIDKSIIEAMGEDIDGVLLSNKQKAFAVMSYAYGNLVGVTTTGVALGLTVLSNPDQYFVDGKLSFFKIRKAFKSIGEEREYGYRYQSVFVNKLNKDTVINKFGRVAEFVRVSAHEVREFDTRLKKIDVNVCTKEDLVLIAKDLDVIGRAMQELAIDVTKDKSKDIGYNVMSFIQVKTKTHSRLVKKGKFTCNLDNIIKEHLDNKNITSSYTVTPNFKTLASADCDNKLAIAEATVEDIAGEMMEEINDGYIKGMNELVELFKLSHDKMYNKFIDLLELAKRALSKDDFETFLTNQIKLGAVKTKEEAMALKKNNDNSLKVAHMVKCTRIALSSITSLYSLKQNDATINSQYIKEIGKKLRAGLYTEGAKLGFSPKNVVNIAIAASFSYIDERTGKISTKKRPSLTELWTIFPKEFILEYVAINNEATIKDLLTVKYTSYDLCLNDELVFDEGFAETEFGHVVVAENYSGKAIVTENGIEAVVDHYAYEPTEVMFLDTIYKRNVSQLSQAYIRPTELVDRDEMMYNNTISSMIKVAEQGKVARDIKMVDDKEVLIRDYVIKKGNNISIIGTVLSKGDTTGKIDDAIITNGNGGVVFFK